MKKKKLLMVVLIILIILIGIFIIKPLFNSKEENGFLFEEIKKGSMENIVSSTGTLSAVETVEVGSQVSGIIKELSVDFNDSVKKGQILAVLDRTLFEVAVKDAEAGVFRARAKLERARAEVNRNLPLFKKGYVSEMEFLLTKTEAQTAEAELKMAEASLNRAKTNLEYTIIRSPIDGTIIERTVDAGQTIAASFQAPKLFIIAQDLTRMQIEANVDESDIGQIRKNQNVRFTVQAYSEKNFTGKVRQIRLQPQTIQNVVNYTVIVDAPNRDGLLLPGMTATVDFIIEQVKDVLMVSNKALNFSPPAEMMKTLIQKQMKSQGSSPRQGSGSSPGQSRPGGGNPFSLPEGMGRIFYSSNDGALNIAIFEKGVTDGIFTEIKRTLRGKLEIGTRAITGIPKVQSKKSSAKNTILPRPGGRR